MKLKTIVSLHCSTLYTIQCAKSEVAGPSVSLAEWGSINSAPALRLKSTGRSPMEWGNTVFVYSSNSLQSGRRLLMAVVQVKCPRNWSVQSGGFPVDVIQ